MPLFGFGDIQFDKGITNTTGPLADLIGSPYKTNFFRYPKDVGAADKGHYMVIYIRKQANSKVPETNLNSVADAASQISINPSNPSQGIQQTFGGSLASSVNNSLSEINKSTGGVFGSISSTISKSFSEVKTGLSSLNNFGNQTTSSIFGNAAATQSIIDRNVKSLQFAGGNLSKTQLTKDFIALYMPDTLLYSYQQNYANLEIGSTLLGLAGASIFEQIQSGGSMSKAWDSVKAAASQLAQKKAGDLGRAGAFLTTGAVINPILEVLYQSPNFRNFQYDFYFYPRDEREAVEVQKIINLLKFHQAPELSEGVGLLIPPSEFDIKFYYGGKENENIPKVGTCVLKSIDINYAPNGFSAYEVPGQEATIGGTGMPVAIQLTLQFQEIFYLTKNIPTENASENQSSSSPGMEVYGTSEGE